MDAKQLLRLVTFIPAGFITGIVAGTVINLFATLGQGLGVFPLGGDQEPFFQFVFSNAATLFVGVAVSYRLRPQAIKTRLFGIIWAVISALILLGTLSGLGTGVVPDWKLAAEAIGFLLGALASAQHLNKECAGDWINS